MRVISEELNDQPTCRLPLEVHRCALTIWVLLAGDLEQGRECCLVPVDSRSYPLRDLSDQRQPQYCLHDDDGEIELTC